MMTGHANTLIEKWCVRVVGDGYLDKHGWASGAPTVFHEGRYAMAVRALEIEHRFRQATGSAARVLIHRWPESQGEQGVG